MKTEQFAIVAGAIVVVSAMLTGHDGAAIAAFFGLLAGLGLGRKPNNVPVPVSAERK